MTPDDTTPTPWEQRRAAKGGRPNRRFAPDVARARTLERVRRTTESKRRASVVLAERYPEEFERLRRAERAGIDRERGPLPGDETPDPT